MVIATWCQREETPATPFSDKERADLQFLYDEWAHPYFVSVQEYGRLLEVTPMNHHTQTPRYLEFLKRHKTHICKAVHR